MATSELLCPQGVPFDNNKENLQSQTHLDQPFPSGRWRCSVCDRAMAPSSKASHLGGKPHAAAVRAAATIPGDAPNPIAAATLNLFAATKPADTKWHCEICNLSVVMARKDEHLATERHRNREQSPWHWHCNVCDRLMTLAVRSSHLAGKPHAAAVRKGGSSTAENTVPAAPSVPAAPEPTWTCELCNVSVEIARKDEHIASKHHIARQNGQWYCNVCDRTMSPGGMASHLAGKPHAARLKNQVQATQPKRRRQSTRRRNRKHWYCLLCSCVMVKENKEAHLAGKRHAANAVAYDDDDDDDDSEDDGSEYEDDDSEDYERRQEERELLMDIDTQWGTIPGGGAYKESDDYDPDMVRDHYGTWDW